MDINNRATFTSNIDDNIVMSFTYAGKPTKLTLSEKDIKDLSEIIVRFGIDSFVLDNQTTHPLSYEQLQTVYTAIARSYSTH